MKRFLLILIAAIVIVIPGFFFLNLIFNFTGETQTSASSSVVTEKSSTQPTSETTTESTTEETDPVKKMMTSMSLEEKVGQLFLVRVPEVNQLEDIQTYHLGGYLLFGRDTVNETAASFKAKIAGYQEAAKIPMLIGSDEEGGTVTRISTNANLVGTPFQSPQALYANGGWEAITQDVKDKAAIFKEYGIQTGLFPIADVATDPQAFIYDRTIGQDAKGTSKYVETAVKAMKEAKIGSTLKHFPGYGNNRDSHVEIVTDDRPLAELRKNDFLPFEAGIKAGADSILVSHNIVSSIDPNLPASISKPVHDIIRDELKFDGVVMTDDMDMAGLADFISQEKAGLQALQAGNDLILSSTYQTQIPYIIQAVKDGEYTEEALDQSVQRVLAWKVKLGLIN